MNYLNKTVQINGEWYSFSRMRYCTFTFIGILAEDNLVWGPVINSNKFDKSVVEYERERCYNKYPLLSKQFDLYFVSRSEIGENQTKVKY